MKKIKIFPLLLLMCVMMTALAPSAWAMEAPQLNGKAAVVIDLDSGKMRSEERRVGKECRSRWSPYH